MFSIIYDWLKSFFRKEDGQTLSEYALILVLVALAVIIILALLGTTISDVFQRIVDELAAP